MRQLIRKTPQWADVRTRLETGERAKAAGVERAAEALATKNVLPLRKEEIFWLARQWGLRSNIWRRRSSADLLAMAPEVVGSLAAARKRARWGDAGAPTGATSSSGGSSGTAGTVAHLRRMDITPAPARVDANLFVFAVRQNTLPGVYNIHVRNHELVLVRWDALPTAHSSLKHARGRPRPSAWVSMPDH